MFLPAILLLHWLPLRPSRALDPGTKSEDPAQIRRSLPRHTKIALGLILEDHAPVRPEDLPATDPSAYDSLAWNQLYSELARRIGQLPEKEAMVIEQHYRQGLQFQQIAILMGLSKGRTSQLHAQGLERLRKQMSRIG